MSQWSKFRKKMKGKGLTMAEVSKMYKEDQQKRKGRKSYRRRIGSLLDNVITDKLNSIENFAKKLAATKKGKEEQIFVMRDNYRGKGYVRIGSNQDLYMDITFIMEHPHDKNWGPVYEVIDSNVFGQEIFGDLPHMKRLMTYFVNKAQDLPYEAIHYGDLPNWIWEWAPKKRDKKPVLRRLNPAHSGLKDPINLAALAAGAFIANKYIK